VHKERGDGLKAKRETYFSHEIYAATH